MEWMVCIVGDDFDLAELSKSLTSTELSVIKENNEYYLKSTDFNELKDADEVQSRVEEILSLVNGASRLVLGIRRPLTKSYVIKINDDGSRHRFVSFSDSFTGRETFRVTKILEDGTVQEVEVHQAAPIPNWIKLAQNNQDVAKVLRLLSNFGYDWVNLYRIFEIVMKDVGGASNIKKKGWATKQSIDRFTGTEDNPKASGDSARHGIAKHEPTPNPMTVSEARSFIKAILDNWLRSKTERS